MEEAPLSGRTVGVTADRRAEQQLDLFRQRGAEVLWGPTMRTVDLAGDDALRSVTAEVIDRPPDWTIVTTGMGLNQWLDAATGWNQRDPLLAALGSSRLVARGAKSSSAARKAGLEVTWQAPEETTDEIVEHLAAHGGEGARVALQLFDPDGHPTTRRLGDLAGELVEVPVYRWLLPTDLGPAEALVDAVAEGRVDAVTFTSQPAVRFLARIAADRGRLDELLAALNGPVLPACVGPVCAEAAREVGIERPRWPETSRLVPMVKLVTDHLADR